VDDFLRLESEKIDFWVLIPHPQPLSQMARGGKISDFLFYFFFGEI
jgi:hypothetical protein